MAEGPVLLQTVGDAYIDSARVLAILWEGATTSGDTAEVRARASGHVLWRGRTDTTQTYQGMTFGPSGLHAEAGFVLSQLSAGIVYVYLRED